MIDFSVLLLKAGDHYLEFALFDGRVDNPLKSALRGTIDDIGSASSSLRWNYAEIDACVLIQVANHEAAIEWVIDWLQNLWPFGSLIDQLCLIAHQVVDCKPMDFSQNAQQPMVVSDHLMTQLMIISPFISDCSVKSIDTLRKCREIMSKKVCNVLVFNSAIYSEV